MQNSVPLLFFRSACFLRNITIVKFQRSAYTWIGAYPLVSRDFRIPEGTEQAQMRHIFWSSNWWELFGTGDIAGFLISPHVIKHVIPIGCNACPALSLLLLWHCLPHVSSVLVSIACFCFAFVSLNLSGSEICFECPTDSHSRRHVNAMSHLAAHQRTVWRVAVPRIGAGVTIIWYAHGRC